MVGLADRQTRCEEEMQRLERILLVMQETQQWA